MLSDACFLTMLSDACFLTMLSDASFLTMLSHNTQSMDVWNACCSSWPTFSSSLVVKGKCQDSCQVTEAVMQVRLRLECLVLVLKAISVSNVLVIPDRGGWSAWEGARGSVHCTAGTHGNFLYEHALWT